MEMPGSTSDTGHLMFLYAPFKFVEEYLLYVKSMAVFIIFFNFYRPDLSVYYWDFLWWDWMMELLTIIVLTFLS